ncbi:hypothetical protein GCK72_009953 [Caenorhabditis remanei]|uniref:Tyrosine-protein kinase n=1 Tax=Caenorhabditis remanei TaxID=31234 RepID=A0A6A5H3B7_CAERE|nr:hypothetical protein GCK72_009953 [Caenorhabditis remanei]KAF1761697.1 hypothetical protein GCK72_009953 [Caenorhabditis remanei]
MNKQNVNHHDQKKKKLPNQGDAKETDVISSLKKSSSTIFSQIRQAYNKKGPQEQQCRKTKSMETSEQQWFHGLLPREEVQLLLQKNGDFLVRMSEPGAGQTRHLILSVMQNEPSADAMHYVIRNSDGKFSITGKENFDSLIDLINHHKQNRLHDETPTSVLINPIGRQSWELNHADVTMTKTLGEGAFGEVKLGTLKRESETLDCAVKTAKLEKMTKEQIKEITSEARIMRGLNHKNVVRCYGVAAVDEPLLVVMELVPGGGLDGYLQKNSVSWPEKLDIITQVAAGIAYIHSKNIMHRDIAARNVLYGKGVVSDFGMSRIGTEYQMNPNKKVPIRWLSPETLITFVYTQQTDIFAFSILCWEVIENGTQPYPEFKVVEVHQKVAKDDYRMPIGDKVPSQLADVIKKCWTRNANLRPSMSQVVLMMTAITGKKETTNPSKSGGISAERAKIFGGVGVSPASDPNREKTIVKTGRRNVKKRPTCQPSGGNSGAMLSSPSSSKEKKKKGGKTKH